MFMIFLPINFCCSIATSPMGKTFSALCFSTTSLIKSGSDVFKVAKTCFRSLVVLNGSYSSTKASYLEQFNNMAFASASSRTQINTSCKYGLSLLKSFSFLASRQTSSLLVVAVIYLFCKSSLIQLAYSTFFLISLKLAICQLSH